MICHVLQLDIRGITAKKNGCRMTAIFKFPTLDYAISISFGSFCVTSSFFGMDR